MTLHGGIKFVIGHVLAGAVVILGTLLVTLLSYVVMLAKAPEGIDNPVAVVPEFLTLMTVSGIFAVAVSTASFLLSVFLQWLRTKRPFLAWLPVGVVPLLVLVAASILPGQPKDAEFLAMVTGLALVYFGIYWTLLLSSGAVLDFLRRKWMGRRL